MIEHLISPLPPLAGEELPHIGAGLRFLEAPTAYLQELRERHGDTYLVDLFGFKLLMTFAPRGLASLYKLEEDKASFGLATYDMIGFKTPSEIFQDADIGLFYKLLLNKRMPGYLIVIDDIVDRELQRWGAVGSVDIFDAIRTLEQRVGYGLWIAPEAADDHHWPALKSQFDVIDQESSFVDPQQTLLTIKTNKAREKAAVAAIKTRLAEIIAEHDGSAEKSYAAVDFLRDHFSAADVDIDPQVLARKVAHSAINTNQGFLSNLYAAIAWVIVRLLQHPAALQKVSAELAAVRAQYGDSFCTSVDALNALTYLEQVTMESVRLAQRSLTLRKVVAPVQFDDGAQVYTVQPGIYIATMLSVTNMQTPELARFDPDHYQNNNRTGQKNQLAENLIYPGKETISTFGHGKHACPAQKFSHHMCKIVVAKILARFDLTGQFSDPQPSVRQMGGVSRPEQPARVSFNIKAAGR